MRLSPDKSFIVNYAPIFSDLTLPEKNLIIQKSKVVEYNKGDIIYKQHDPADAFYCVISGRVRIFSKDETLEYLNCAKYFGIISLLTGEPHSVSAQAANDSKLLRIAREDFQTILHKIPQLAIDLSQSLSRRLRKKDIKEKKVFESNIVSIFSAASGIGRTMYAINLSLSLKRETSKNIILVDVSRSAKEGINLDSPFFSDELIKRAIFQDETLGISILNVGHYSADNLYAQRLNALLTQLTGSFHYIIIDLPALADAVIFEVLRQSDIIHILTDYDLNNLEKTKVLLSDLFQKVNYPQEKIKVIVNAKKEGKLLSYDEVTRLLNYKVYAVLPVFWETEEKIDQLSSKVVLEHPQTEYAKAIRRIAREMGDVRVGLALSGGAALGLAQIGVIKVLERENIPIDILVGSSMGALLGALWAAGLSSQQMEEIALEYNHNKKKVFHLLVDPCLPKLSFMKGRRIRALLEKHIGNKTFQDTRLPFKVVACNLTRRKEFIFDSGSLTDAVMASIAIPGIFFPTRINSDLLVDGGIAESVPIGVLVKLGIRKIIAVNTLPSPENMPLDYKAHPKHKIFHPNILDIIVDSIQMLENVIAETECQKADVVINPAVPGIDWFELFKAELLIKRGEEEANKSLGAIKNLVSE